MRKAEPFNGSFPLLGPPTAVSDKVHQRCAASLNAARMILAGYDHNIEEVSIPLKVAIFILMQFFIFHFLPGYRKIHCYNSFFLPSIFFFMRFYN